MKKAFIFLFALIVTLSFSSCEKEYSPLYSDNRPEVPVTFAGTTSHGFNPYITRSVSDTTSAIEFTLEIPASSNRSIKEISKVAAGATGINAGNARTGTYISSPIPGSGKSVKFTTSYAELKSKVAGTLFAPNQEIAFMFLITLDNGQEIIPVQVRIRMTA